MSDRIVYVCGCTNDTVEYGPYAKPKYRHFCECTCGEGRAWTSDDCGHHCAECGQPVEAVNLDAPQRQHNDHIAAYNLLAEAVSKLADEVARLRAVVEGDSSARDKEDGG